MAHTGHVFTKHHRREWPACLREIFPPSFWKRRHAELQTFERCRLRWGMVRLWYVGLCMALEPSRNLGERFERARETCTGLFPKRRRCGRTWAGFLKAVRGVPRSFFGAVRQALQARMAEVGLHPARMGRWEAYGIDGTKSDVPRTAAHEARYGLATKGPGAPQRQVVAAVALRREVLWDWESGSALDSERELALRVIRRLPEGALVVLDAGFLGYGWGRAVRASGRHFLARVGGNVRLWVESQGKAQWREGEVWLWPEDQQEGPPLVLRLLRVERRVRGKRRGKGGRRKLKREVLWLATDVLDEEQLTCAEAGRLYARRWPASEGTFRTWKRTLDAAKLYSRTPELAERESEFSLCALQVLEVLAWTARQRRKDRNPRPVSVARARRVWRKAVAATAAGRTTGWLGGELAAAITDSYRRRRAKVRRAWPQRKEHRMLKGPEFRKLGPRRKQSGLLRLQEQDARAS